MATYGKISSSLLNFNATTTPIDNPITSRFPTQNPQDQKSMISQRGGPSLNLGLFQSTPYVLTPINSTSNNPQNTGDTDYCYGNNITLVTPNTRDTQPRNAVASLRVPRYQGSFMDKARGMRGSIIIGHDIGTAGFSAGTDENSATFGYPPGLAFEEPNVIIGSNILEGLGSQGLDGYGGGEMAGNTIMGIGFGSALVDQNLDYVLGGYGYGAISRGKRNAVMGNNNYAYAMRSTPNGYSASLSGNTIIGNDNGIRVRFDETQGYFVGPSSPIITERANIFPVGVYQDLFKRDVRDNCIIGNENLSSHMEWQGVNTMTDPFFGPDVVDALNIILGHRNQAAPILNFDYDGSDISNNRFMWYSNIVLGRENTLIKEYVSTQGQYGPTNNIVLGYENHLSSGFNYKNIILGSKWQWAQVNSQTVEAQENICIGSMTQSGGLTEFGPPAAEPGSTSARYNVMIGAELENGHSTNRVNHENVTLIGYQATTSSPTVNNEITLGNSSISALRCNVTSITSLSDARDKANIEPISNASAFIKDLKPVKFDWNRRDGVKAKEHDIGFLAQDLDEAQSKHGIQEHLDIVYKSNPEALEASYGKLLPILVQALKEQQEEIEKLKSTN